MVSATSWKLETPVTWSVSRQRYKWFQHVFRSSEPWCPSAVILLMYWLLRFSVCETGTCQGGDWRGLWGQSRQKAASWGPMLGFLKNEHTILIEHTQGRQSQELKGSASFWKTVATFFTIWASPRRRQWHPTPVLLLGKSHGRRSLVGCHLWGRTESDTTEAT